MMVVCSEIVTLRALLIGLVLISVLTPIQSREAIKEIDDINVRDKTKVNEYLPDSLSVYNDDPCKLDIQKDLPKTKDPQPLYIVPGTNELWYPNGDGYLEIPNGANIELYCSNFFDNTTTEDDGKVIPKNTRTIQATCIGGDTFKWRNEKYQFRHFICSKDTRYSVERLGKRCAKAGELYRVGYNITGNRFIETMRICYDDEKLINHYTQYRLYPGSVHFQRYVKRLNFSKAGFFEGHNVNSYYTQRNQKAKAIEIFKSNDTYTKYFNGSDMFLSRGHLAAKSDFIYANQQRSTFTFLNVAPQWQTFNAGQWNSLEDAVRKYVMKMNLDVDCYSGTWGTLYLKSPNETTVERPFYLASGNNNEEILPVPKLFFRVIISRKDPKRGIVLIGVNNPHLTKQEILNSYIVCKDIAADISWLLWIRNTNLKKGYIYACTVAQFTRVMKALPKNLRNVVEVLA